MLADDLRLRREWRHLSRRRRSELLRHGHLPRTPEETAIARDHAACSRPRFHRLGDNAASTSS